MESIEEKYDFVILGTGLTECILASVLSTDGHLVLQVEPQSHYGHDTASVDLETLFKKYGNYKAGEEPWTKYGRNRDWNVDVLSKLIMSTGELSRILATIPKEYMSYALIAGSYVQQGRGATATIAKLPTTPNQALRSSLMGMFEKLRVRTFIEWIGTYEENNPTTHKGLNMSTCTMKDVYDKFGLEAGTRDFVGHAMALYTTDDYITAPGKAPEVIERIKLYGNSVSEHGSSPYVYPFYGVGELAQAFSRISATHRGTVMLRTSVDNIIYDGPKASGIEMTLRLEGSEPQKYTTKFDKIIADPSFFPDKVKVTGHLLKAICILTHPIAGTENADSTQIIIPQSQVGRKNDIYVAMVSSAQMVCPKGYYIAIVTTIAETSANHHLELEPGLALLGKIEEQFMGPPIPLYEPLESGANDNIFISKSYDATSHFETMTADAKDTYRRACGKEMVFPELRKKLGEDQD